MAERTVDVMPDTVKFTSEEGQDWGVIPLNDGVTFPQYRIAGPVRFVFNLRLYGKGRALEYAKQLEWEQDCGDEE